MATLEKPKKKTRKNNTKQKAETLTAAEIVTEEDDNDDESKTTTENVFKEFEVQSESAQKRDIVSHDCYVAASCPGLEETENEQENLSSETDQKDSDVELAENIENISLLEELQQANAATEPVKSHNETPSTSQEQNDQFEMPTASAPPAETNGIINSRTTRNNMVTIPVIVQYPNLAPLQVETKSTIVYQPYRVKSPVQSQLKPFTEQQLKQIYHCQDLDLVKQHEIEFLMNLVETYDNDPLYAALKEYYNLQSKLTMNFQDIENYRKYALEKQKCIWKETPVTKTFIGRCADRVEVQESVTYNIAQIDNKNLEASTAALKRLFDLVCNTFITNQITAQVTKVKINQMINEIVSLTSVPENSQSKLNQRHNPETLQCLIRLRRAIAILFTFARKMSPNANFDLDLKCWLRQTISLLLLLATKEDHWFLIFNMLRCPSGIGNWATEFLQIPFSLSHQSTSGRSSEIPLAIDCPEVNNCISILQIILFPIKKRNEYLKAFTQSQKEITDPVSEERWILIDSDGEDSHTPNGECVGLKESDLIALLNQIPFEKLFMSALNIEKFLQDYIIEPDLISANQMLKVTAFFSKLLEILGEGMLTYNKERYKQFAKRLGRLMRHTLQYISDYHELFIGNKISKDPFTCERIIVELNALLIKTCSYIYRTRNLSTWQYFSSLPFNTLHCDTVWQLFYYFNLGFPPQSTASIEDYAETFDSSDFWKKFNEVNADISAEDLYYLLQAFFEMANERDKVKDWELIKTLCLHIFNIGYINEETRDICYKTARDMLVNLTLAYEDLMSCLVLQMKAHFKDVENGDYLFKSLPLENWKPAMDSFEIISNWLLHYDFKSAENTLARIIISHLNWDFDCDGRLFLPHNIHVRMACLITEALTKHTGESMGSTGITESVRQVTNLLDFSQSTKEHFTNWCWSMISILRLHLMDQSIESIKKAINNPAETLIFVPELERVETIYQGVTESRPLALYVALLVSLHGHSIPLICQKGLDLVKTLLNDNRHAAAIRSLELIVPLFLETPETLASCENFHTILNILLNADKTYLKMAKDMLYPNAIGPVLELLDDMIHHQIINYTKLGLTSPMNLIYVWLNCLTSLPNWQTTNVVYLLDKILRIAYQFPDAHLQATECFYNYYKDCDEWKSTNKMSSLKNFFGSNQYRIPALSPNHCWLALTLLEIEYKTQDSVFWTEFLRQLSAANSKTSLESVLKKTTSLLKISTFPPNMLVLYKYANLISTMDIAHPLFPIMTQKFFELYLSRIPSIQDHNFLNVYGVSDKFYEHNVPLMKKIKTNLKAAEVYYTEEATKTAQDDGLSHFNRDCAKIMKAFAMWLEENSINRFSKEALTLPPQYCVEKLREILSSDNRSNHWTEYLYLPAIRKEQRYQAEKWSRKCYRITTAQKQLRSPLQPKPRKTPIERIKAHLSSYDKIKAPPAYSKPKSSRSKAITENTLKELKVHLKTLTKAATKFHLQTGELNSVNRNYLDEVLKLYKMVPYTTTQYKSCNSLLFNRNCSEPAKITITTEQIRKDEAVARKLETYQDRHDKILDEIFKENMEDFANCVDHISDVIKILITSHIRKPNDSGLITKTGIGFFYNIVENMNEITMKFQPTHDCYSQILTDLGVFIQDNQEQEGLEILDLAIKRSDLIKVLSGVFAPFRTRPDCFIRMYKFLVDSHLKRCDTKVLFVLFSKFDLDTWLDNQRPKLYEMEQLLQLILQGLESWSQPDSQLLQDQFRRHLIHVYNHNFPEHYGEVLQKVLERASDQKLMPEVLLDLLNSLLTRFNCDACDLSKTTEDQVQVISIDFARRQNLFTFKAANDTIMMFARHFQKERLNHGLHGLYPKHKDYCKPLAMWFSCMGHTLVVTAICTYQDLLAEQLSDLIFGSFIDMYSPWLVTYNEQILQQQATANWIRQLCENGKVLYPWSAQHANTSKIILKPFLNTLLYILENLPASQKVLGHTFSWYVHHFATTKLESYIYTPVHEALAKLPWETFRPEATYIDMFHSTLQKYIPESHAMLGHIFIRINWSTWFTEMLPMLDSQIQVQTVSRLFTVFVKIAFEPNIHLHPNTSKTLEDAIEYAWYMVEYGELENLLKWFVSTVEPTIILKLPTESNYADRAALELLRLGCAMMPERLTANITNSTAKRILYSRTIIYLLKSCGMKNPKVLGTKDGLMAFKTAFLHLLVAMNDSLKALESTKTLTEQQREALNLMIEVVVPMQTQSEEVSNYQTDVIVELQRKSAAGNLLMCSTLMAIGHMKALIRSTYTLLESSIAYYFRTSEATKDYHHPTWRHLMQTINMTLEKLELMPIMGGPYHLVMHMYILFKLDGMKTSGEQVTFLQDLVQLVESLKTCPETEARLAIVWGIMIASCCKILLTNENAKKPLLMLGRSLHAVSSQSEGWSDGLLGAIGIKRDNVTNRRKVLGRCLACVAFSACPVNPTSPTPQPNHEYTNAFAELTNLLANKKFFDIKPLIVQAINLIDEQRLPNLRDIPHLVSRLIALFYDANFLTTIPEVWDFDFKLSST